MEYGADLVVKASETGKESSVVAFRCRFLLTWSAGRSLMPVGATEVHAKLGTRRRVGRWDVSATYAQEPIERNKPPGRYTSTLLRRWNAIHNVTKPVLEAVHHVRAILALKQTSPPRRHPPVQTAS